MKIVHLTASTFHGGPERQMLGLAEALADDAQSVFLSFAEGGRSAAFLGAARRQGHEAAALQSDTPYFRAAVWEIAGQLRRVEADVLCCHGYKANLLGRPAARRCGVPAVAVSRGWTGESFRVRLYERLDRFHLRFMDHVVAVSQAQAEKALRAGARPERVTVIANAIDPERFADPDPCYRQKLERYFPEGKSRIVGAAGRLSPEKGFDVLLSAAARVIEADPSVGFVIFGHGDCKLALQQQLLLSGLVGSVVLAGFRNDLDRFLPQLDLFVLPSYTEGMPNVVLESCAAGVPVVATAVGGTPEVLENGVSGALVPPGDPDALASAILDVMECEDRLREMGFQGRQRVLEHFSFPTQKERYLRLFAALRPQGKGPSSPPPVRRPLATERPCKR